MKLIKIACIMVLLGISINLTGAETLTPSSTATPSLTKTPTLTVSSTPTITPTMTSEDADALIDNFENDASFNDQPQAQDSQFWANCDATNSNLIPFVFREERDKKSNFTKFTEVTYLANGARDSNGYLINSFYIGDLNTLDKNNDVKFADYDFVQFQIIRLADSAAKLDINIQLIDNNTRATDFSNTISLTDYNQPHLVNFDIENISWQLCDRSQVKEIMVMLNPVEEPLKIYIDDIRLVKKPTPTVTLTASQTVIPTQTITPTHSSPTNTITLTLTATPSPQDFFASPAVFVPGSGKKVFFNFEPRELPSGNCTIRIINMKGRIVKTLQNENTWDGTNQSGDLCSGGVYIYQVDSGSEKINGKVVLIR